MRMLSLKISAVLRGVGCLTVAAAIVFTAIHLNRNRQPTATNARVAPVDAALLTSNVEYCQSIGMAAQNDASCDAAWAENRRRFFTFRQPDYPSIKRPIDQQSAAKPERR